MTLKETKKSDFCENKKPFKIDNIDGNKILESKKESYGKNKWTEISYSML